ncbi:uncharacterized protein ACLA_067290 [Aspergillus clavatus NRRL 1]|uniref:Ubiquitin 3 binding protein But2 C-terminal domain-containing protein n=1 Tax=Aspergillus clavatus (strain ATCC 1007 / CBS 513.65 / DSM 816 / NCTC 3887 / NRRL 1 / QM 1276 / 107) TaxID=344612 RepID=A1CGL2_ASPCL|nr:uncharacterized protein ACLA_067290 [Aspergillus clavatus NRRL 1]EAW11092.1 conserved hypothetical protein [Aspergillus clavatus NRRL 1]
MFKSIALFGLLLAGASAVPTPTEDLVPRACSTLGPSTIDVLRVSTPDNASPGLQFTLSRAGSPVYNTQVAALTFEYIPTGATGCMLEIDIPPLAQVNQIAQGATQVDIWTTDPWNWNNLPTWNHPPTKRSMVGTYIFPTQQTTTTSKTIVMSNTCDNIMSFQVELSGWQNQEGSVNFFNTLGGKVGLVPIGFRMIYNC